MHTRFLHLQVSAAPLLQMLLRLSRSRRAGAVQQHELARQILGWDAEGEENADGLRLDAGAEAVWNLAADRYAPGYSQKMPQKKKYHRTHHIHCGPQSGGPGSSCHSAKPGICARAMPFIDCDIHGQYWLQKKRSLP